MRSQISWGADSTKNDRYVFPESSHTNILPTKLVVKSTSHDNILQCMLSIAHLLHPLNSCFSPGFQPSVVQCTTIFVRVGPMLQRFKQVLSAPWCLFRTSFTTCLQPPVTTSEPRAKVCGVMYEVNHVLAAT